MSFRRLWWLCKRFIHGSISRELVCLRDAANVGLATQGLSGTTQQQQQQQQRSIFSASEAIVPLFNIFRRENEQLPIAVPWFEFFMAMAAAQMASKAASFLLRASAKHPGTSWNNTCKLQERRPQV